MAVAAAAVKNASPPGAVERVLQHASGLLLGFAGWVARALWKLVSGLKTLDAFVSKLLHYLEPILAAVLMIVAL